MTLALASTLALATSMLERVAAFPALGTLRVTTDDLWVMATAIACGVACGVPGCYLVLRRLSLLGDAISHAVLPGLAVAFLITSTRDPLPMLGGAMVAGLITTLLIAALQRYGRVPADAAMGVVFSSLFALGVLLITWVARDVDLDPGCVLYGQLEFVSLDTRRVLGFEVPQAFAWLAIMSVVNLGAIALFYKELKIVSFDPALATALGINVALVHYGLMASVAASTVASFQAVGSVLVVAMIVAPGATAHLLTDRLGRMLALAALLAGSAAALGCLATLALHAWFELEASVAGMVAVAAGAQFLVAMVVGPRHGIVSKLMRNFRLALRIRREDVLGALYRLSEAYESRPRRPESNNPANAPDLGGASTRLLHAGGEPVQATLRAGISGVLGRVALASLMRDGLVERVPVAFAGSLPEAASPSAPDGASRGSSPGPSATLRLTRQGLERARALVRSHRLWEGFLESELGLPPDHVHGPSHRVEHYISPAMRQELAEQLRQQQRDPRTDPHGKTIPDES
ncbi:MAG: metal ABC transporter permease [Planctomycetota bacterium]|nr:metal ABC transporter permease [Planctomycetota bacterium]